MDDGGPPEKVKDTSTPMILFFDFEFALFNMDRGCAFFGSCLGDFLLSLLVIYHICMRFG